MVVITYVWPSTTPGTVILSAAGVPLQAASLEGVKIHDCPPGSQDDSPWSRLIQGDKHGISTTT